MQEDSPSPHREASHGLFVLGRDVGSCKPRHHVVYSDGEFSRPYRIDVTPQMQRFSIAFRVNSLGWLLSGYTLGEPTAFPTSGKVMMTLLGKSCP
jgi:hypothetical protein